MENKIVYSREVENYIWSRLDPDSKDAGSWYNISDEVTLDISEVFASNDKKYKRMDYAWTGIELIEENEIFIHQSCMCYPNFSMLYLTVDELKNIYENLEVGYTYKNIKVTNIENKLVTLNSDSQEEHIKNGRCQTQITKGLLLMAIGKLRKEKISW